MDRKTTTIVSSKIDTNLFRFSMRSSFIIMSVATVVSVLIPALLWSMNIPYKLWILIGNSFITSFSVAYCLVIIEKKLGYNKLFVKTYVLCSISFFLLVYLWLYLGIFA